MRTAYALASALVAVAVVALTAVIAGQGARQALGGIAVAVPVFLVFGCVLERVGHATAEEVVAAERAAARKRAAEADAAAAAEQATAAGKT